MFGEGQRKPMKRGKPLKSGGPLKRTPLKQGNSTLKSRSAKTQKKYTEERIPFVKKILAERPLCQACPVTPVGSKRPRDATDVHEILTRGRSGGVHGTAWLDEENVLALCRTCHTWVTNDHTGLAEKLGLIRKSGN